MLENIPFAEITALIALAVSVFFGWTTQQHSKSELRLELARDQSEREAELKKWIGEVIRAFADLNESNPKDDRKKAAHRLSSLADFGRLFFPNDRDGYRSRLLDPLVKAVRKAENDNEILTDRQLRAYRKQFVNRINEGAYVSPFDVETSPEAHARRLKKA